MLRQPVWWRGMTVITMSRNELTRLRVLIVALRLPTLVFLLYQKGWGLPHLSGSRRGLKTATIVAIPNNNKLLRTRIAGGWFVGPEGRQNPSYPVISESYRGCRTCATPPQELHGRGSRQRGFPQVLTAVVYCSMLLSE